MSNALSMAIVPAWAVVVSGRSRPSQLLRGRGRPMSYILVKLAYSTALPPIGRKNAVAPMVEKGVLVRCTEFADHDGSNVRPAQRRIALDLDMSERSVRGAISQLVERGILRRVRPANPLANRPAEYRIDIATLEAYRRPDQVVEEASAIEADDAGMDRYIAAAPAGIEASIAADPAAHSGRTLLHIAAAPAANPSIYPSYNPSVENHATRERTASTKSASKPDFLIETGFDQFWSTFPRRDGKAPALKAYSKAVKGGANPAEIEAGARLFAAQVERERRDARYIPMAATWLNAGRWADESLRIKPETAGRAQRTSVSILDIGRKLAAEVTERHSHDDATFDFGGQDD